MKWFAALLIPLAALLSMYGALAHDHGHHGVGHDKLHHWYRTLMRPDVPHSSCCNETDCRPTQAKLVDGTWHAKVDGEWTPIPETKVNREESYDTQAHVCAPKAGLYPKGFVYCFVKPSAGI